MGHSHIANVLAALHHHHIAEDELLWPTLHARVPLRAEDVHRMETEHALIAKLAGSVERWLAQWIATADSTPSQSRAAEALISEMTSLADLVGDHLNAEEERVVSRGQHNRRAATLPGRHAADAEVAGEVVRTTRYGPLSRPS